MSIELNPWLDQLDSSRIDAMNIDLDANKITFKLTPKTEPNVDVAFEGVSAFYYIDDSDPNINSEKESNRMHSIAYHRPGFGEFASVRLNDGDYDSSPIEISIPNFAISLNDSSMYIEARSIYINGNQFDVPR